MTINHNSYIMNPQILRNLSLPLITVILILLFLRLSMSYSERFDAVEQRYATESAVNLSKEVDEKILTNVLLSNNYMQNTDDAQFAAHHIATLLHEGNKLGKLSDLDKRAWQIKANDIDSMGSPLYRQWLAISRERLGCDSTYYKLINQDLNNTISLSTEQEGRIIVKVERKKSTAGRLLSMIGYDRQPCYSDSLVVRLSRIYTDSTQVVQSENIAYASPDKNGVVTFEGLDTEQLYSVLPIREGCEYGTSKGTIGGSMASQGRNEITCLFVEQDHRVRVFDATTMRQIKKDHSLTVRSPQEFKAILVQDVVILLLLWWILSIIFAKRQRYAHISLITILTFLTGLSLMMMFSINDPLSDELLGNKMAYGIYVGIVIMGIFLFIDFTKFYQGRYKPDFDIPLSVLKWLFKPYKQKVSKLASNLVSDKNGFIKFLSFIAIVLCLPLILLDVFYFIYDQIWVRRLSHTAMSKYIERSLSRLNAKGIGYMLLALLLTTLLFTPLGAEVGGMKVNLNIGFTFQPSEIAKYLIIIFIAAFFSVNSDMIMKYSEKGNTYLFGDKLRMLLPIVLGLSALMLLYMVLGDMGPAMVLAFTFIIMYSMIKSKVSLENAPQEARLSHIFSCDIAMLIYGVVTFILLLVVGHYIGNMAVMAGLWFILWIGGGILRRQIFETPVFFNTILAMFLFGGSILGNTSIEKFQHVADRLDSRMEMCTNTWGTLPLDGKMANAGENTQVAEGLWGLASGGFWGQGLGNGSPHFIPAFHTDMILESIGEQMGFVGVAVVLLLIAMLLRKTIVIGYQSSHPCAFYLCMGIAVVTAVQFIIIALGSTGMIPLTGITVPFFSCGTVSMILNLTAYGIVLSVALYNRKQRDVTTHTDVDKLRDAEMGKYEYPVSILSIVYIVIVIFIGSIFFYYQCVERDDTLIRPVYVNNVDGAPTIEYNPRINQLTSMMRMGDIYDRNGVLLATSDRTLLNKYKNEYERCKLDYNSTRLQRRYYPFGNHLFYMLGDYNTGLYFSTTRGYMAEARHLSDLRGYDNVKRENGVPVKVKLKSDEYRMSRYHAFDGDYEMPDSLQLRDYSKLLPYLKAGINSDRVTQLNEGKLNLVDKIMGNAPIEPEDITLSIDALLQTRLQQKLEEHAAQKYSSDFYNKVRISVILLDAKNGDLLSSANYPLPDYARLRVEDDIYSDYKKSSDWRAYSDMDLGMMFPSQPGSTAKVMTSMAGLRKGGTRMGNQSYHISGEEIIFKGEPSGMTLDMKHALRYSSNVYFVKLANDKNLYADLADIYAHTGASYKGRAAYGVDYITPSNDWMARVTNDSAVAVAEYRQYDPRHPHKMNRGEIGSEQWSIAWGQGSLTATPLSMARVVSVVANDGMMPVTRYRIDDNNVTLVEVMDTDEARLLKEYMQFTATNHDKFRDNNVGGKTGTPERTWKNASGREFTHWNDGWFICYIDHTDNSINHTNGTQRDDAIAVAVRIERLGNAYSGRAVEIVKNIVIPTLQEMKYY